MDFNGSPSDKSTTHYTVDLSTLGCSLNHIGQIIFDVTSNHQNDIHWKIENIVVSNTPTSTSTTDPTTTPLPTDTPTSTPNPSPTATPKPPSQPPYHWWWGWRHY